MVGAGVDLISELADDLLLRILSFLPAASDAARTSALSRRWRHLWPNAVALRFAVGSKPNFDSADGDISSGARRLIAGADATLARRDASGGPDVEDLELSFVYTSNVYLDYSGRYLLPHRHAADIMPAHVDSWLRFATQRVTGRFTLAVPNIVDEEEEGFAAEEEVVDDEPMPEPEYGEELPEPEVDDEPMPEPEYGEELPEPEVDDEEEENEQEPVELHNHLDKELEEDYGALFVELPCSIRAREMSLTLANANLTVPAAGAGAFSSLTDIMLSHVRLGCSTDDTNLGQLLSSCCSPRLRRAELRRVSGLADLIVYAADTLVDLRLFRLRDLQSLTLDAPSLRRLEVKRCNEDGSVSAPELELLASDSMRRVEKLMRFDGAASVRRIEDLPLYSHRLVPHDDTEYENSAAMWFLQHCTGLDHLAVDLTPSWFRCFMPPDGEETGHEDMMTHIPELPHISNLTIDVTKTYYADGHRIGASVAKLIAKCTNIQYLSINIDPMDEECTDPNCICDHPKGWENQKIQLENLKNVEIRDGQLLLSNVRLVQLLLSSAPALERVIVIQQTELDEDEVVEFDVPSYGGHWAPCVWECDRWGSICAKKYTWAPGKQSGEREYEG